MLFLAHGGHGGENAADASDKLSAYVPLLLLAVLGVGYVWLAVRAASRQGWRTRPTVAFVAGLALLGVALSPGFDEFAETDFSGHAAQHMLLAMVAPLLLVLGTPVTLLLRTLPHPAARRLGSMLNTGPVHVLTHPVVALVLASGGLVVLYFTPLYQLSTQYTWVHLLVHAHLLASGFLFAWVIAGLDPAPSQASIRTRLVVLGVSIVVHASVSQLLYAGLLVQVREPVTQMQAAGSLMYFGGDIAELLLALSLLVTARSGSPRRVPSRRTSPAPRYRRTTPVRAADESAEGQPKSGREDERVA